MWARPSSGRVKGVEWLRFSLVRPCRFTSSRSVRLCFLLPPLPRNIPGGAYIVTKKLPERNGEFEYRVKSINEPYERVVRESQLSDVP